MDVEKYRAELEYMPHAPCYAPWKDKVFDLLDAYDALRAQYVDALVRSRNLQAVIDLHQYHPPEGMAEAYCVHDVEDWPCSTIRAAKGES